MEPSYRGEYPSRVTEVVTCLSVSGRAPVRSAKTSDTEPRKGLEHKKLS